MLADSFETYKSNIRLVLLFSIPFIIAFLIPLIAVHDAYVSAGGIFLRTANLFHNPTPLGLSIIAIAEFFSLLFISLAFVLISLIVKSKRTHVRIGQMAFKEIEKNISKVFIVLLIYTFILLLANIAGYYLGYEALFTIVVGIVGIIPIFYVPSAIVVDGKSISRAVKESIKLIAQEPQYFLIWIVSAIVIIFIVDFASIIASIAVLGPLTGTTVSEYLVLILNSLFILPYFIIFIAEAYMKKFKLLKH